MNRLKAEDRRFLNKMFLRFLIPSLFTAFSLSLSNIVDSLVIGQRMQESGLAAVSLTLPIYMIYNVLDVGLATGSAMRVSQLLGSGDAAEARRHFTGAIRLALLVSLPFVLIGLFLTAPVIRLLGASPEQAEVYRFTFEYAQILLCAAPLFFLNFAFYENVRIDNDEILASAGFIAGTVADFVLNFVFVLGLNLGVRGAILATVIGQTVSVCIYLAHFLRPNHILRFVRTKMPWKSLLHSYRLGFAGSSKYVLQFVFLVTANQMLMHLFGPLGVAVFDFLLNINYVVSSLFEGCLSAMQPLVNTFTGEQNRSFARAVLQKSMLCGTVLTGALTAAAWIAAPQLCAAFGITDAASVQAAAGSLRIYLLSVIFAGWNLIYSGYAQASGHEKWCYFMTFLRNFAVLMPCMLACTLFGTLTQFWWMYPLTELLSLALWLLMLRRKHDYFLDVTDDDRILRMGLSADRADVSVLMEKTERFCEQWEAGMKQTYYVTLVIEEICTAIQQNAKTKSEQSSDRIYIQITLIAKRDGSFELHLRDNARIYNPMDMITKEILSADSDDGLDAIGILMVKKKAKQFFYRRYLGFNVLVITV